MKTIAWEIREPDRAADKGVKVASAEDLLALKLAVIHERVEAKDYLAICALLRGGLSLAEGLAHLDARHPLATDAMIGSKTLTYFKGGDLDALPAKVKSDLEGGPRGEGRAAISRRKNANWNDHDLTTSAPATRAVAPRTSLGASA